METMSFARQRLEEVISHGVAKAGPVIDRVLSSQPEDTIVRVNSLGFDAGATELKIRSGEITWALHSHAAEQMYERLGGTKFKAFANHLRSDSSMPWRNGLLEHNLREFAQRISGKYLVRAVRSGDVLQARAVLSDKYRRLDNRPLLDAFIGSARALGAVPYEGVHSDLSASVRAIIPQIYEPIPNEAIVFGLAWTNSDFGARRYEISAFVLRLVCLNGMVGASQIRQVHLGGRLDENMELSQRTYDLDTKTMVSATGDVVRAALNPRSIETQLDKIREVASVETDMRSQWAAIGKALTKSENEKVREAFDGPDTINLPAGKNQWRLGNALSWVANTEGLNPERKLEMQSLAGKVVA